MTKKDIVLMIALIFVGATIGAVFTGLIITRELQFREQYEIISQGALPDTIVLIPVQVTVYNPTAQQCDATPLITADGTVIDPLNPERSVAVSAGVLNMFSYGDSILLSIPDAPYLNGYYEIHDTMGAKDIPVIDILVANPTVCNIEGSWKGYIVVTAKKKKELKK